MDGMALFGTWLAPGPSSISCLRMLLLWLFCCFRGVILLPVRSGEPGEDIHHEFARERVWLALELLSLLVWLLLLDSGVIWHQELDLSQVIRIGRLCFRVC